VKAWPAVIELRLTGAVNLLAGVVAIAFSLASRDARGGLFAVIAGVALGLGVLSHLFRTLRGIRRAQPVAEPVVIGAVWPGVAPSGFVAVVIIFESSLGSSWVLGAACVLISAALFIESAVAARVERRRGTQLLRVERRFVLTPSAGSVG
jgi:hypothetical protein